MTGTNCNGRIAASTYLYQKQEVHSVLADNTTVGCTLLIHRVHYLTASCLSRTFRIPSVHNQRNYDFRHALHRQWINGGVTCGNRGQR
jgi:hypothetical protein